MLFFSDFRNIKEDPFRVEIVTGNSRVQTTELILNGDCPVRITQESSGIFTPVKSRSCTVSILVKDIYPEFYTFKSQDVTLGVYPIVDGNSDTDHPLFEGYVTPGLYTQPYASEYDFIDVEAVDRLSSLKQMRYSCTGTSAQILSTHDIVTRLLQKAGYAGTYTKQFMLEIDDTREDIFENTYIQESNFFDDDEEQTPWTCFEVLEEICLYFGLTLVIGQYGVPTFLSYDYVKNQSRISITYDKYYGDDANVSYDDVYNKITISQNTYDFDDLIPDINESSLCDSVTKEANLGDGACNWTHTKKVGKLWSKKSTTIKDGEDWATFAHAKPSSGWTHRFYHPTSFNELDNTFFDASGNPLKPYSNGATDLTYKVNTNINTVCALVEKYTGTTNSVKDPSSLSWDSVIMFQRFNDRTANCCATAVTTAKPVLEYESKQEIQYSPSAGDKSWLCFKGDLWYQSTTDDYKIYNTGFMCVSPLEKVLAPSSYKYSYEWSKTEKITTDVRQPGAALWGTGFNCLTLKIQIGDKWWNGTTWTTTESTFNVKYNNAPGDDDEEHTIYCGWMSPVSNFTYSDKVGEDCWAIPITSSDGLRGKLKFTIYTPSFYPGQSTTINWSEHKVPYYMLAPVVFMKNMSLTYKFTSQELWYLDIDGESYTKDIAFTNETEDGEYVQEDTSVTCRLTSFINEDECQSQLSKSHVLVDGGYLGDIYDPIRNETDIAERLLVTKYYDHFKGRKLIYDATLEGYFLPTKAYTITAIGTGKVFILDSYDWDVHLDTNTIGFIEL